MLVGQAIGRWGNFVNQELYGGPTTLPWGINIDAAHRVAGFTDPALRFHPSFATLARTIAPDIEIYRFDINEDWRSGVHVVRRERINA